MSGELHILTDAFYAEDLIRRSLGLNASMLAKARKAGELKYAKRGKRVLYRGDWLRDWLEADAADDRAAVSAGVA